jgi:hypothetical protein
VLVPSHFQKNTSEDIRKDHTHGLLLIHGWVEAVLAVAVEHVAIYNKWEMNPKHEDVLS